MASANRLIDWRHFCRRSNKMAEMSVPAWPMPIHQTKLTIANPHPTGILIPQTPTPMVSRYAVPNSKTKTRMKEIPNPTYQNRGVRCVSTMALILSVTDANVWPGSMTGTVASISEDLFNCSDSIGQPVFDLRVGICQLGTIRRARLRIQLS